MDILYDMGVSKLPAKVFFFKVNYSFKVQVNFAQKTNKTNALQRHKGHPPATVG